MKLQRMTIRDWLTLDGNDRPSVVLFNGKRVKSFTTTIGPRRNPQVVDVCFDTGGVAPASVESFIQVQPVKNDEIVLYRHDPAFQVQVARLRQLYPGINVTDTSVESALWEWVKDAVDALFLNAADATKDITTPPFYPPILLPLNGDKENTP